MPRTNVNTPKIHEYANLRGYLYAMNSTETNSEILL